MRQLTPCFLVQPHPLVDTSEAQVAPSLERRHPEPPGEDQGRRVILECLLAFRRFPVAGNLTQEEESARFVPARALTIRDVARLPGVPAVAETLPGYEVTTRYGLVLPTGTPSAVRDKLQSAVTQAVGMAETRKRL